MKKIIYITVFVLSFLTLSSCSEDLMDDIGKNVNNPPDAAAKLTITDMMVNAAFTVTGSDLAFYASCYIEHNVGVYGQMYDAEIRNALPTSSDTYNGVWKRIYRNLYNLKKIIDKCSKGGVEEGNFHTLGIAQVLSAYNLAVLTDLFGDVPFKEALQPKKIFTPKLDSQESIYKQIFSFLDEGMANLAKESSFPDALDEQDLIYKGEIDKWTKFAYGLKARYTMRLSLKNPKYDEVIALANQSFTDASEQCLFNYNGASSVSPFYAFYTDRNYFGASKSLHDKLAAREDPRDAVYFKEPAEGKGIQFAPNGEPKNSADIYGISGLSNPKAPTFLMSYHELEFLKAEAYARKGDLQNAKDALKKAIIANCAKENVGISEADATAYYNDHVTGKLTDASNTLNEIMVQKYIACYEEEAIEAYNDIRRWKAMGNNAVQLDSKQKFPLRFTYGSKDVTNNINVKKAYGDGTYVYTENVWWAGGNR